MITKCNILMSKNYLIIKKSFKMKRKSPTIKFYKKISNAKTIKYWETVLMGQLLEDLMLIIDLIWLLKEFILENLMIPKKIRML